MTGHPSDGRAVPISLRLTPHGHLIAEGADAPEIAGASSLAARLGEAFAQGTGHGLLAPRRGRGRPAPATNPRLVARLRSPLRDGTLPARRRRDGRGLGLSSPRRSGARRGGPRHCGADSPDDDRRRIPHAGGAAGALGRDRPGGGCLPRCRRHRPAELPEGAQPGLEPGRPRAFQPGGEPHAMRTTPSPSWPPYTTHLSAQARAQHLPLGQALREYAGAANRAKLLSAAAAGATGRRDLLLAQADDRQGEIFHPLRWTPGDAARLLTSATDLERAGVVVRMPATWRAGRPSRPQVAAVVGSNAPSVLGLDGLLDFTVEMTLGGETLSDQEIAALLAGTESLVLLRGQWVEVDRERLTRTLDRFQAAEALARRDGLTFAMAMRMLAGLPAEETPDDTTADWSRVTAGPWLAAALQSLRAPNGGGIDPGPALHGTLRPYQKAGAQWLHLLSGLGLGACLADDMGLGKTIQVLALLLAQRQMAGRCTTAAVPPGGSGLAAGELDDRDRAFRSQPDGKDPASLGHDRRRDAAVFSRSRPRSWTWQSPATARSCACRSWPRSPGGSSSSTRPRRSRTRTPSRPGRQGPEGSGLDRPDRDAGRERSRRPLVDLRFHQPGPPRHRQAVRQGRRQARRTRPQPLRPAARARPAPTSCGA